MTDKITDKYVSVKDIETLQRNWGGGGAVVLDPDMFNALCNQALIEARRIEREANLREWRQNRGLS